MRLAEVSSLVLKSCLSAGLFSATLCFGADPETAGQMFTAIRANDLVTLRALAAAGANQRGEREITPLMFAAAYGSVDAVKLLVDAGAEVNARNALGYTALLWSVTEPAKAILLLEHGADANAKSRTGRTPLMIAAMQNGSEAVVQSLIAHGADPLAVDQDGLSFLLAAASGSNPREVRLAVEKGANVNAADGAGFTPLMKSVMVGDLESARFLLSQGANVNAACIPQFETVKNGPIALGSFTPLLLAAVNGSAGMVSLLLRAGANVNARDIRGMTPLHLAIGSELQNSEIVRLLLKAGADATIKDKTGQTASDWAAKYQHPEVVKLLPASASTGTSSPAPEAPKSALATRAAVERSLQLLHQSSDDFVKTGGCVACHAQNLTAVADSYAAVRGIAVSHKAQAESAATVKAFYSSMRDGLLARVDPPGSLDTIVYSLFHLSTAHAASDTITDSLLHNVAAQQFQDGSWHMGMAARAPMENGDFSRTALAVRALSAYSWPARQADLAARVHRARGWLLHARPVQTEDAVMQLLGLLWAGDPDTSPFARALIAGQRPDGGWAQNPNLPSDAYATGLTLFALAESGNLKPSDPVFKKGIRYLLSTQEADGSWHVNSRSPKFQPYFESGFPHGHDQWISMAGTAWAAIALSFAGEPKILLVQQQQRHN